MKKQISTSASRIANRIEESAWIQGFGLALAEVNRQWDQPGSIYQVMRAAGLTSIDDFKRAGLEEFDLKILRRVIRSETPTKSRRKHSRDGSIRCDLCSPLRCEKAPR